jgi:asparagine synthase (glutamine-hydrolysing)
MCGTNLVVRLSREWGVTKENVRKHFMMSKHRGPDDTQEFMDSNIFIMFHRLLIVGKKSECMQPFMFDGIIMQCNGMIYNHKELEEKYGLTDLMVSDSDCEIILRLYNHFDGDMVRVMQELDSECAVQLYDTTLNRIYISRDRMGIRPLYWSQNRSELVVSSEMMSMRMNDSIISHFPPASVYMLDLDTKDYSMKRYWELPTICNKVPDYKIVREKFMESIKARTLSDVEIGLFLSGGLDSSLTSSGMVHFLGKGVKTFSFGFSDNSPDLIQAKKVADFLETDHHTVVGDIKEAIETISEVIEHLGSYDTTTIRASIPMYLLSEYVSKNTDVKSVVSGEFADELMGGYLYSHNAPSDIDLQKDMTRLLEDLVYFDLTRGDRALAAHGLEGRFPIGETEFLEYFHSIHPKYKHPKLNKDIEKYIFRQSFDCINEDGKKYIPDEILKRVKEAYSDGVGSEWVKALIKHAEEQISDEEFDQRHEKYPYNTPMTKEALLYRKIFDRYYPGQEKIIPYYWMPKWCGEKTDPSATVLDIHKVRNT